MAIRREAFGNVSQPLRTLYPVALVAVLVFVVCTIVTQGRTNWFVLILQFPGPMFMILVGLALAANLNRGTVTFLEASGRARGLPPAEPKRSHVLGLQAFGVLIALIGCLIELVLLSSI